MSNNFAKLKWMLKNRRPRFRRWLRNQRRTFQAWKWFWKSYNDYSKLAGQEPSLRGLEPYLFDASDDTPIDPLYFYQDSWAFERIVNNKPQSHVDVGSQHKFVAHLSKVVPLEMVDIRPLSLPMDTINFKQGSILALPYEDNSLESISSLCVVEHIGLGRYGDELDPYGTDKSIEELKRVLKPNGHLYLSVPVGEENRVAFNAGRIFKEEDFLKKLAPLTIVSKKYIVGDKLTDHYEPRSGFGTTILLELTKP